LANKPFDTHYVLLRMSVMNRKAFGLEGEEIVARYLEQRGFTILEKNYRKRFGEVDLIASNDTLLIFVEVKRRNRSYFDLAYLITPSKQKKIIMVAKSYLAQYDHEQKDCRFDVALLKQDQVTYIPNAFQEGEYNGY